jgi:hypothetical protein
MIDLDQVHNVVLAILPIYPVPTVLICRVLLDYEGRLKDEEAILQSELKYRNLVSGLQEGIW